MPHTYRAGDVLRDRYCLVDRIDQTAVASVWRAFDSVLSRHVALHVMGADDERADRVVAGAQQAAALSDRRLLRILDADRTDDAWLVVVEWAVGRSLETILEQEGPLTSRRAAWLVGEVADSLAGMHQAGAVHGRLVPENVVVEPTGTVRIAGACIDPALRGLSPGSVSRDLADLGGLLYAALTGRWAGPSLGTARMPAQRTAGRYLRPRQVRPGVPRLLDEVCDELVNPRSRHAHHRDAGGAGQGRTGATSGTARGVCLVLREYVGDAGDLPLAEAALYPSSRTMPRSVTPSAAPAPRTTSPRPGLPTPAVTPVRDDTDDATQAALPVFDDDDELPAAGRRRSAAVPPPRLEDVPERPLYAPGPTTAVRPVGDADDTDVDGHDAEDPDEEESSGLPRILIGVLVLSVVMAVAIAGVLVAG